MTIPFLNNIISNDGILIDFKKFEAVVNQANPMNAHVVRSFLRLAGYYCCFIEGLNGDLPLLERIASSYVLQNVKIVFKSQNKVVTISILTVPTYRIGFVIYGNPSRLESNYILMLHGKFIAYTSCQLQVASYKYMNKTTPRDLELATIMFALKI